MKQSLCSRNFTITDGIRKHVDRACWASLTRLRSHIKSVEVILSEAGKRGSGKKGYCAHVSLHFHTMKPVIVKESETDMYFAIENGLARAGEKAQSQIDKRQRGSKKSIFQHAPGMFNLGY